MIANISALQIVDCAITRMDFTIKAPNDDVDLPEVFGKYTVDIDFGIVKRELIQVFITAKINMDEKLPGYCIEAEAGCFFKFSDEAEITEQERNGMEGFSTIYIALNSLRGLISNFTANAPFGRYILPSIDLNDLVMRKQQQQTEEPKLIAHKNEKKNSKKRIDAV